MLRMPSRTEHWFGERPPEVGAVLVRLGIRYVVTSVDETRAGVVVTLAEAEVEAALPAADAAPATPAA